MSDTFIIWIVLILGFFAVLLSFRFALDHEKGAEDLKEKLKDLEKELRLAEDTAKDERFWREQLRMRLDEMCNSKRYYEDLSKELSTTNEALQEQVYYLKMRLRQVEIMRDSLLDRIEKLKSDIKNLKGRKEP
jgi:chromosome segregation ATPase